MAGGREGFVAAVEKIDLACPVCVAVNPVAESRLVMGLPAPFLHDVTWTGTRLIAVGNNAGIVISPY